MSMCDTIVSFETAQLAKEKGFDVKVRKAYHKAKSDSNFWDIKKGDVKLDVGFLKDFNSLNDQFWDTTSAPTQALLQKWLREKYNIIVEPCITDEGKWYYDVFYNPQYQPVHYKNNPNISLMELDSYEEALEAGLQKALNLIK